MLKTTTIQQYQWLQVWINKFNKSKNIFQIN